MIRYLIFTCFDRGDNDIEMVVGGYKRGNEERVDWTLAQAPF